MTDLVFLHTYDHGEWMVRPLPRAEAEAACDLRRFEKCHISSRATNPRYGAVEYSDGYGGSRAAILFTANLAEVLEVTSGDHRWRGLPAALLTIAAWVGNSPETALMDSMNEAARGYRGRSIPRNHPVPRHPDGAARSLSVSLGGFFEVHSRAQKRPLHTSTSAHVDQAAGN